MPKTDVILEIAFNTNEPDKTIIKTNTKKKTVGEIKEMLERWLFCHNQIWDDEREPKKCDIYKIKIQLGNDTVITVSDAGNQMITRRIIIDIILKRLYQVEILGLP